MFTRGYNLKDSKYMIIVRQGNTQTSVKKGNEETSDSSTEENQVHNTYNLIYY